ncbi:hypothetical protein [Micromonospora yangpuensis]|uniref:Uncharacterized protein n=1 Tax=Micromonospora yangpuensis TaxID=683228 RepID=A0A1C6UEQ1_9ACTN|nr:hypothetical protein [Micromonospora yangpuensis]GGM32094.1 hypothetical protein GCM10012279_58750 [Micromonospora yangpuensis]SCL52434.1 hypothetical protein GA0070617_2074 [Micromonospora yangpuensis]
MRSTYCTDLTAADWLLRSAASPMRLITFGPAGFEAYGRLRFIPDPTAPGQDEADADLPDNHPFDLDQARRALHLLARFTATPQECYFCVWDGYSDIALPPTVRRGPLVELPHRRYALLRGPLSAIDTWADDLGDGGTIAPPALVWPTDRRWCFVSDVDPHWAGIGADRAAITALTDDPHLDVVPADPTQPQPWYR